MIAFASDNGVGDMKKTYEKPVLVKTGVLPYITAQENAAGV
jgi:hypothetical protein